MDLIRSHVMVCGGTNCSSSASGEIIREFERQIAEKGLEKEIKVVRTGCFGMCEAGPVVIVYPEGAFYARMTVENVTRISSRAAWSRNCCTRKRWTRTTRSSRWTA